MFSENYFEKMKKKKKKMKMKIFNFFNMLVIQLSVISMDSPMIAHYKYATESPPTELVLNNK